jgi:NAD(P)-dependent dehydrogenase (short-subunit alcohol dehydrogenase family)
VQQRAQPQGEQETALLAGRVLLVAGGTGNVGQYVVRALLADGATVVVPSRSEERLAALRATVGERDVNRLMVIHSDISDERKAVELTRQLKAKGLSLHAVVAALGRFIATPSVLAAPISDVHAVLNDYLIAHLIAARSLVPVLEPGGTYVFINGPLAFDPLFEGAGLVSISTAAQAMLARVLIQETRELPVRLNEVVVYTPFGWADKEPPSHVPSREEVGRYVSRLISAEGVEITGRTIHLNSRRRLEHFGSLDVPANERRMDT